MIFLAAALFAVVMWMLCVLDSRVEDLERCMREILEKLDGTLRATTDPQDTVIEVGKPLKGDTINLKR